MSLSLWIEWRLNLDFSVQTVINKFVSITWLTSDLYVSTVLHAIVFRTLPREAFPRSMFIFPTPCFRAQFQTKLHRMHSDKSDKALLWILDKWIYSTSRIRKVLKAFRINKRQSDIEVRGKLSSRSVFLFFPPFFHHALQIQKVLQRM